VSDHWYTPEGQPRHLRDNGKATTLRDARKEGLVPSVTTILNVKAKPGLERWKRRQDILTARDTEEKLGETDQQYIKRIQSVAVESLDRASSEGDAIHKAIECAFKGEPYDERHAANVAATLAEVADLFPDVDDWVAECCFAHPLGFGGTVDLHSPSTGVVVDYKSKDGDLEKRLAYDQYVQIAAYRAGLLLLPGASAANIFVSRDEPGVVKAHVWTPEELEKGWIEFSHCLALWKLDKNYEPAFEAVAA
jgi:hypothetical protein